MANTCRWKSVGCGILVGQGIDVKPYDDETRHATSSKGFTDDRESEVSWTANSSTEAHELHMRHRDMSKGLRQLMLAASLYSIVWRISFFGSVLTSSI